MSTVPNVSGDKLRRVAKYQRAVIFALLTNIGLLMFVISIMVNQVPATPSLVFVINLVSLGVVIFIVWSVFMLAKQFNSTVTAVIMGILSLIPFASLIVLLIASQNATKYLLENGVRVGFFGVNPSTIA